MPPATRFTADEGPGDGVVVLLDGVREAAHERRHQRDDERARVLAALAGLRRDVCERRRGEVPVPVNLFGDSLRDVLDPKLRAL